MYLNWAVLKSGTEPIGASANYKISQFPFLCYILFILCTTRATYINRNAMAIYIKETLKGNQAVIKSARAPIGSVPFHSIPGFSTAHLNCF